MSIRQNILPLVDSFGIASCDDYLTGEGKSNYLYRQIRDALDTADAENERLKAGWEQERNVADVLAAENLKIKSEHDANVVAAIKLVFSMKDLKVENEKLRSALTRIAEFDYKLRPTPQDLRDAARAALGDGK